MTSEMLDIVLERKLACGDKQRTPATRLRRRSGAVVGVLCGIAASGKLLVRIPDADERVLPARSIVSLGEADVGREVVLIFERGHPQKPIVMGLVQSGAPRAEGQHKLAIELDGQSITLAADQEITLRCGKSSITLTRAGKVLIRGAYLLSRSSGVNRIKGGSVQIN